MCLFLNKCAVDLGKCGKALWEKHRPSPTDGSPPPQTAAVGTESAGVSAGKGDRTL